MVKVKTKSLKKFLKLLEASLKPYPAKSMKTLESQVREQEVHAQRVPISKKWEIALGSESLFHSFLTHSKRRGIKHSRKLS